MRPPPPGRTRRHDGSLAITQAGVLLVLAVLAAVAIIEGGVLLRTARVAQTAADGAALAAVTATAPPGTTGPAASAARAVAEAHGATLAGCTCGSAEASVAVRMPVASRLLRAFGITHVRARSAARLVPDQRDLGLEEAAEPISGSLVDRGGTDGRRPMGRTKATGDGAAGQRSGTDA